MCLWPDALRLPDSLLDEFQEFGRGDFAGNPCQTSTAHNRFAQCGQPNAADLSPLFPGCLVRLAGRWDGGLWESLTLPCEVQSLGAFPACQTEPTEPQWGNGAGVATSQPRSQVRPAHPPVAALSLSGSALGWSSAVAPIVCRASREPVGQEGDKSEEAVPWPVVDVQPYSVWPGRA